MVLFPFVGRDPSILAGEIALSALLIKLMYRQGQTFQAAKSFSPTFKFQIATDKNQKDS